MGKMAPKKNKKKGGGGKKPQKKEEDGWEALLETDSQPIEVVPADAEIEEKNEIVEPAEGQDAAAAFLAAQGLDGGGGGEKKEKKKKKKKKKGSAVVDTEKDGVVVKSHR